MQGVSDVHAYAEILHRGAMTGTITIYIYTYMHSVTDNKMFKR